MPNTSVRAAAEGMPNVNRRTALMGAATFAATMMAVAPKAKAEAASELALLEAAFNEEFAKHLAQCPQHSEAEEAYMKMRGKRPEMPASTPEEVEAIRQMTIAEIGNLAPSAASIAHAEAVRLYNKADAAARRRSGFAKLNREFEQQLNRVSATAWAVVSYPAQSLADLAVKIRVHKKWAFDESDLECLVDDVARVVEIGGAA
jgi:hypothetical protein